MTTPQVQPVKVTKTKSVVPVMMLSVVIFLVSLGAYVVATYIVKAKIENAKKAQIDISTEENKKRNEQNLIKIMQETSDSRAKLPSFFVKDENIVGFIEEVEAIGQTSGTELSLSAINAGDMTKLSSGEISTIKARVVVSGSWTGVMRALSLVENMPYRIAVDNVRIDKGGEGKTAVWKMDFDMTALLIKS
jgi:hypothetical protein